MWEKCIAIYIKMKKTGKSLQYVSVDTVLTVVETYKHGYRKNVYCSQQLPTITVRSFRDSIFHLSCAGFSYHSIAFLLVGLSVCSCFFHPFFPTHLSSLVSFCFFFSRLIRILFLFH